ncbi:MAG: BTAD domain-containing putative transcriptional regulator [Vulcanimicrobiaceae bacterium]
MSVSPAAASPGELVRDRLLERLERLRPSVVAMYAPAGFGKTTLLRQYLGQRAAVVCDCGGVRDALDVARRLIPTLALEQPEREPALAQRELQLADGAVGEHERLRLALEAWRAPGAGTVLAFDHVEAFEGVASAREFFIKLLAQTPPSRTVVICSRVPLRLHLTRVVPPHALLVLRADDLTFDADEVRRMLDLYPLRPGTIERVTALSEGWPTAVRLFARFAQEGRLETLLDHFGHIAFDELHDYLMDAVLVSLDAAQRDALLAAACIPEPTVRDVALALGNPQSAAIVRELARSSPFVALDSRDRLRVHPLLAAVLVEHRAERCDALLLRCAQEREAQREFIRSAQLYVAAREQQSAAATLGRHEFTGDALDMEYARVLASLDQQLVKQHPRLWSMTALLRLFSVDTAELLEEAESVWRTLPRATGAMERFYIMVFRVRLMAYLGMTEDGLELLDRFVQENAPVSEQRAQFFGYIDHMRGILLAGLGRIADAERYLLAAMPVTSGMHVATCGIYLSLACEIARARGERPAERRLLERALEHSRSSALANVVAFALAEAVFGAWLAGEEALFACYACELAECVAAHHLVAFAYFAAVAAGKDAQPTDADLPRYVVYGRLLEAANHAQREAAVLSAASALAIGRDAGSAFLEALAAFAVALVTEPADQAAFQRAREAAAVCQSSALESAIEVLAEGQGDCGPLQPFARRMRKDRAVRPSILAVELCSGVVTCEGRAVVLSEREWALLAALAMRRDAISRERLAELLWPDLDGYAARNALGVCLYRLRARLGREDTVLRGEDGYRLHPEAQVDLWEIERAFAERRARPIGEGDRSALSTLLQRLRHRRPERTSEWSWFEPVRRRLDALCSEVAALLAGDALARGDGHGALELAQQMIAVDPCDEPARELAIRAYLVLGDRPGALRHYRQYRDILRAELQCDPSPSLSRLLTG